MSENLQKLLESPFTLSEERNQFDLEKVVRQFAEKNNSAETRRTYAAYLKEFFAFVRVTDGNQALRVNTLGAKR